MLTIPVRNISNRVLFIYIIIFIVIVFVFSRKNIKLNFVFGVAIAFGLIYYLHVNNKEEIKRREHNHELKKKEIFNAPDNVLEHTDMVNFLFSIHEFHYDNPQAHDEMMKHLEAFFNLYEEIMKDNSQAGIHYDTIDGHKREALNALNSIIFKVKPDKRVIDKLNRSVSTLEDILIKYQSEIHHIHLTNIHKNGYNNSTKLIDPSGPRPYNIHNIQGHKNSNLLYDETSYYIF